MPAWLGLVAVCVAGAPLVIVAGTVGLLVMAGLVAWDAFTGPAIKD